jgi:hypothetical protein
MKIKITYLFCFILFILFGCANKQPELQNRLKEEYKKEITRFDKLLKDGYYSLEARTHMHKEEQYYFDVYTILCSKLNRNFDDISNTDFLKFSKEEMMTMYRTLSSDVKMYTDTLVKTMHHALLSEDLKSIPYVLKNYDEFNDLEALKLCILKDIREYQYNVFCALTVNGCYLGWYDAHPFINNFNLTIKNTTPGFYSLYINQCEVTERYPKFLLEYRSLFKIDNGDTLPLNIKVDFLFPAPSYKIPSLQLDKGEYLLGINVLFPDSKKDKVYKTQFAFTID